MNKKLVLAILLVASSALASNFRTGQVNVTTTPAVQIGNTAARVSITITNTDGTNPIYCGNSSSVSSSTGLKISAGQAFTLDYSYGEFVSQPVARQSVYCVATGNTVVATFLEDSNE